MLTHPVLPSALPILALIFILAGLGAVAVFGPKVAKDISVRRYWLRVEATVLKAELRETVKIVSARNGDGRVVTYFPMVTIRYHVAGQEYLTSCFDVFSMGTNFQSRERTKLESFPVGAKVSAWVNPADHREAVVRTGGLGLAVAIGIPSILLLMGGGIMAFIAWKRQHKAPASATWYR